MTKKHFEKIAELIKISKSKDELVENLIKYFKETNPMFNERLFRARCK